jgi:hypothetical protein
MESIKSLRWWHWKKYAEGHPPLHQRHGFIKSMPLEGLAASPIWWWCLVGDLCFLCGFWLVAHPDTSYLRFRGVTKWPTQACTIPRKSGVNKKQLEPKKHNWSFYKPEGHSPFDQQSAMFWEVRETCRTVDSQWLLKISSDSEIGQLFDLFLSLSPHLPCLYCIVSGDVRWARLAIQRVSFVVADVCSRSNKGNEHNAGASFFFGIPRMQPLLKNTFLSPTSLITQELTMEIPTCNSNKSMSTLKRPPEVGTSHGWSSYMYSLELWTVFGLCGRIPLIIPTG